ALRQLAAPMKVPPFLFQNRKRGQQPSEARLCNLRAIAHGLPGVFAQDQEEGTKASPETGVLVALYALPGPLFGEAWHGQERCSQQASAPLVCVREVHPEQASRDGCVTIH